MDGAGSRWLHSLAIPVFFPYIGFTGKFDQKNQNCLLKIKLGI